MGVVRKHDKWLKVPLIGEENSDQSGKKRKLSDFGNFNISTNDVDDHFPEDAAPTRQNRKGKKPVESRSKSSVSNSINSYAMMKGTY